MQGWRQPQPSGTNRPSSYPSHPRGRSCMCLAGATQQGRSGYPVRRARCAAPRARGRFPFTWEARNRLKTSAAHRSAAMAGGARPDPFRTRKLSRRAPMVLRGQPVGEQGAADRWTALDPYPGGLGRGGAAGDPPRRPLSLSPRIVQPRGPPGPFFHAAGARGRGPVRMRAARIAGGRTGSSVSAAGGGRRLPHGAPPFPGALLAGEGAPAP